MVAIDEVLDSFESFCNKIVRDFAYSFVVEGRKKGKKRGPCYPSKYFKWLEVCMWWGGMFSLWVDLEFTTTLI